MKRDLIIRGYSKGTVDQYILQVKNYSTYYNQSPDQLGDEEILDYLYYLLEEKKLSSSSVTVAHAALRFFYEVTLERPWISKNLPCPKKPIILPLVLDRSEIIDILNTLSNLKHKAIIATAYSAGLRVSEVVCLRVKDIDSKRMQIRVNQGKGRKDRYTLLSKVVLNFLRSYWKAYQPRHWLFEGQKEGHHLTVRAAQSIFNDVVKKTGIKKDVTFHSLRHSFATHSLEDGTDLETIKRLLGHRNIQSTTVYLHLQRHDLIKTVSPLDHFWRDDNDS